MKIHGEALYKIRRGALSLKQFTIDRLAGRAGVDRDTVERAVHRMVADGYLFRGEGLVRTPGKGRPRRVYGLVADSGKVQELKELVRSFKEEHYPEMSSVREPDVPHYVRAVRALTELERDGGRLEPGSLDELRQDLSLARRLEEASDDGTSEATPYLDLAEARVELLSGNGTEAERLLGRAQKSFEAAGMADRVREVGEYAAAAALRQVLPDVAGASLPATGVVAAALESIAAPLVGLASTPALESGIRRALDAVAKAVGAYSALAAEGAQRLSEKPEGTRPAGESWKAGSLILATYDSALARVFERANWERWGELLGSNLPPGSFRHFTTLPRTSEYDLATHWLASSDLHRRFAESSDWEHTLRESLCLFYEACAGNLRDAPGAGLDTRTVDVWGRRGWAAKGNRGLDGTNQLAMIVSDLVASCGRKADPLVQDEGHFYAVGMNLGDDRVRHIIEGLGELLGELSADERAGVLELLGRRSLGALQTGITVSTVPDPGLILAR